MINNDEIKLVKKMFDKYSYNKKYSWMINSDVLLTREDFLQSIYVELLSSNNYESILKNEALLASFIANRMKNIYDKVTLTGKIVEMKSVSFDNVEEFDKEQLSFDMVLDKGLTKTIKDTFYVLGESVSDKIIQMLIDYYVFGYNYEEIADKYGYKNKQGAHAVISRTLTKHQPFLKDYFKGVLCF